METVTELNIYQAAHTSGNCAKSSSPKLIHSPAFQEIHCQGNILKQMFTEL